MPVYFAECRTGVFKMRIVFSSSSGPVNGAGFSLLLSAYKDALPFRNLSRDTYLDDLWELFNSLTFANSSSLTGGPISGLATGSRDLSCSSSCTAFRSAKIAFQKLPLLMEKTCINPS